MNYLFNKTGHLIATADQAVDEADIATRDEFCIAREQALDADFADIVADVKAKKIVIRPKNITQYHQWNGQKWVQSEEAKAQQLSDAKSQQLQTIDNKTDKAISADIVYKEIAYQADQKSIKALESRINALSTLDKKDTKTRWIASDNSIHELSFDDLTTLLFTISERNETIKTLAALDKLKS